MSHRWFFERMYGQSYVCDPNDGFGNTEWPIGADFATWERMLKTEVAVAPNGIIMFDLHKLYEEMDVSKQLPPDWMNDWRKKDTWLEVQLWTKCLPLALCRDMGMARTRK